MLNQKRILSFSLALTLVVSCRQFGLGCAEERFHADPSKLAKAEINVKIAEYLDKASKSSDDNEKARLFGAASELLCEKGDYKRALEAARLGEQANPTQAQALASIAEYNISERKYTEAIAMLQDVVARDAKYARAQFLLGNAQFSTGDASAAEAAYRAALVADPDYVRAANNLAAILVRGGKASQALPFLKDAISKRPEYASLYKSAGIAAEKAGDNTSAKMYYAEYIKRIPDASDTAVVRNWLEKLN